MALFFVLVAFNVASAQVMDTIQVGNSVMINFNYQSLDSILRPFETKFAVLEGNQDLDGDGIRQNEDCDDENFEVGAASIWYEDGDEYEGDNTTLSCTQPQGYVSISGDCDDSVETINPGASEICGDGIDQNCDNIFDDNPAISAVVITPSSSVYVNSVLTCNAIVSHTTALSINYEWRTNSTLLGTSSSITLDPSMVSSGSTLKCTVSATTSGGCSGTGSTTIPVENRPPSAPEVSISPTNPVEGEDDLTAFVISASIDPDGDTVTYEYEWFVNSSAVGCSTNTFCMPTMATDVVQVTVTPNDGTDSGASGSTSVVIVSAP